jgi:hypothetical protein
MGLIPPEVDALAVSAEASVAVKRREQNAAVTPLLRTISLSTWLFMT